VRSPGATLLELARLSVEFRVRGTGLRPVTLQAVREVSLELRAGEALGIVGESGSGKSTLVRAVLQLVRPASGRVVWMGHSLEQLSVSQLRPLRRDLQLVFQNPLSSLDPRMTAGESVAEPLALHRPELGGEQRAAAVSAMLARVGLAAPIAARYPHELSGGQCQRVAIARAMILEPRLLVCDEAVSALDASVQAQIIALIETLQSERGTSILFVSHNLAVVRRICDRVLVLYLGRALESAATNELYERPLHPYTRALLAAVPLPDPERQPARLGVTLAGEPPAPTAPPSGCVFRTRCVHAAAVCAQQVPLPQPAGAGRWVSCHRWRELEDRAVTGT
jgi:oligopeptide transport system ATP-binding protein